MVTYFGTYNVHHITYKFKYQYSKSYRNDSTYCESKYATGWRSRDTFEIFGKNLTNFKFLLANYTNYKKEEIGGALSFTRYMTKSVNSISIMNFLKD